MYRYDSMPGSGVVRWANKLFLMVNLFLAICQGHQTDHQQPALQMSLHSLAF